VEVLPKLEEEARKRKIAAQNNNTGRAVKEKIPEQDAGESRQQAGHLLNVNERYVSDAKRIKEQAPDAVTAKEN